ncbi:uncharacterized protein J8A68_000291, partial [[Candida] subhashii]
MFSKISNQFHKFHKSDNSKVKLLKLREFCELNKPMKKQYIRGLFHKRQAGARQISQEIRQKRNVDTFYAIEYSSTSIYSEVIPAEATNSTHSSASNDKDKSKKKLKETIKSLKTQTLKIANLIINAFGVKSRNPIYAIEYSSLSIHSEVIPAEATNSTHSSASNDKDKSKKKLKETIKSLKTQTLKIANLIINAFGVKSRNPKRSFKLLRFRMLVSDPIKDTSYFVDIYPPSDTIVKTRIHFGIFQEKFETFCKETNREPFEETASFIYIFPNKEEEKPHLSIREKIVSSFRKFVVHLIKRIHYYINIYLPGETTTNSTTIKKKATELVAPIPPPPPPQPTPPITEFV